MYHHFSTEFFVNNRKRLRELFVGTAPIVITANGVLQRNGDSPYAFRQDSSFWYLTGINEPDIILVIDKNKEYLIIPQHEKSKEVFDGAIDREALQQISGVETIHTLSDGWKILASRLRKVKHVATLGASPSYIAQQGFYTNPARAALIEKIKDTNKELELLDLRPQLTVMRMIKQTQEISALQEAIDITVKTFKYIQKHQYQYEYQLEAAITRQFRLAGVLGHGFTPIVSAGVRACVLHQNANNGLIGDKDFVTVDIGAEVDNYSADITRTYNQTKNPSKRQKTVYNAVLAVQDYAFSLIKPGALLKENEQLIEHYMGEKLRELGLIKTIDRESVREYFPHATSHFLGLDVHDVGDYTRPLEPGMVLTVEPGIYIAKEGIGVRIEDDVLVTAKGHKVLSARLPRDIA